MHKLQIHKLVSKCDHWNVSTMYSTGSVYAVLEIKQAFLDSTEISASKEPNA